MSFDLERRWTHLSTTQATGSACVMCETTTLDPWWIGVAVGRSALYGALVSACAGQCEHWAATATGFDDHDPRD